jgi:hypothetical protein
MALCYWLRKKLFYRAWLIDQFETGRYYGIEMNVEKNLGTEDLKATAPSKEYDRSKTSGECGIFQLFG